MADAVGALGLTGGPVHGHESDARGLLQNYRRIPETCTPDDGSYVYCADYDARSPAHRGQFQCIAPVDFELSTEDDFRGITSLELSGLLEGLRARSRNVTVVSSLCFAERVFCGLDLLPMAQSKTELPAVLALLKRL